jgi:hypothetical protein
MITYKTLSLDDLKRYYSDRHGFIFQSAQQSSEKAIQNLCDTLIQHQITDIQPEFVMNTNNLTVFVYPENANFESGQFYQKSQMMMQMGIAKVDILKAFLKEN